MAATNSVKENCEAVLAAIELVRQTLGACGALELQSNSDLIKSAEKAVAFLLDIADKDGPVGKGEAYEDFVDPDLPLHLNVAGREYNLSLSQLRDAGGYDRLIAEILSVLRRLKSNKAKAAKTRLFVDRSPHCFASRFLGEPEQRTASSVELDHEILSIVRRRDDSVTFEREFDAAVALDGLYEVDDGGSTLVEAFREYIDHFVCYSKWFEDGSGDNLLCTTVFPDDAKNVQKIKVNGGHGTFVDFYCSRRTALFCNLVKEGEPYVRSDVNLPSDIDASHFTYFMDACRAYAHGQPVESLFASEPKLYRIREAVGSYKVGPVESLENRFLSIPKDELHQYAMTMPYHDVFASEPSIRIRSVGSPIRPIWDEESGMIVSPDEPGGRVLFVDPEDGSTILTISGLFAPRGVTAAGPGPGSTRLFAISENGQDKISLWRVSSDFSSAERLCDYAASKSRDASPRTHAFHYPQDVASVYDDQLQTMLLCVADGPNNRIQILDTEGTFVREMAVDWPWGLAVDEANGTIAATSGSHIHVFNVCTGEPVRQISALSANMIAVDACGNIFFRVKPTRLRVVAPDSRVIADIDLKKHGIKALNGIAIDIIRHRILLADGGGDDSNGSIAVFGDASFFVKSARKR